MAIDALKDCNGYQLPARDINVFSFDGNGGMDLVGCDLGKKPCLLLHLRA